MFSFDFKRAFGFTASAEERVRACRARLRAMRREIDAQIRDVERQSTIAEREIKMCVKRRDFASAKSLALEVVHARKTVQKLYASRARAGSLDDALQRQSFASTSARAIERSTEVVKHMNALIRVKEIRERAMELSREFARAGVMEELLDDAVGVDEDEDELEQSHAIDGVLREIAGEIVLPAPVREEERASDFARARALDVEATPTSADVDVLKARLEAMRAGDNLA